MNDEFAGLNLIELLDLLKPVPEPVPPSLWPETVGWLWLGVALVLLLAWLAHRWYRAYRANAYRRAALDAIAAAEDDPAALAAIVRRTALAAYPRTELAQLHGESWLSFLDQSYGGTGFTAGPGRAIATAPYQPSPRVPELGSVVAEWVRRHSTATASG